MNDRIVVTSLFCVALACSTMPASATMRPVIRPEIAQHLIIAGFSPRVYAEKEISAAEAVPNQTAEEKKRVAGVRRLLLDQRAFTDEPLGIQEAPAPLNGVFPPSAPNPPNNMPPSH